MFLNLLDLPKHSAVLLAFYTLSNFYQTIAGINYKENVL